MNSTILLDSFSIFQTQENNQTNYANFLNSEEFEESDESGESTELYWFSLVLVCSLILMILVYRAYNWSIQRTQTI